tara:strand:+ start:41 stop:703 length:663 start_codon:yes stop_codon:yes gene_type:complete
MIYNIIFDFDGVLVDSEILAGKAFSQFLSLKNIEFNQKEFSTYYSGKKLVEVVSMLSDRFNIKNPEVFFEEMMKFSNSIYLKDLKPVKGVRNFLDSINQYKKLIGSNRGKNSIIEGLKKVDFYKYFKKENIFSFDMVKKPKPDPEVFLKAISEAKINPENTIIIEDSVIGIKAAVAANVKVIGITCGSHWNDRSSNILLEVGAYSVASNFKEVLKVINNL